MTCKNKIEFTRKSFFGLLSLLTMIFLSLFIFNIYFRQFLNIYSGTGVILIIAFINGFIFGNNIKQSILELIALLEFVLIVYFSIIFAFNPWGNATHIPITLSNIPVLFTVITAFSVLGFLVILGFGYFIYKSAIYGIALKHRGQKVISEENLEIV